MKPSLEAENEMPICPAPWIGLSVRSDGWLKPCCAFKGGILRYESPASFQKAKDSPLLIDVKSKLAKGEYPAGCEKCLTDDQTGIVSKRKKFLDFLARKKISWADCLAEPNTLLHLDISFSNDCNLTCVMCSEEFSSSWRRMTKEFSEDSPSYRPFPRFHIPAADAPQVADFAKNIRYLQIQGGEPLMDRAVIAFLERLSQLNPHCDISLNTNGSSLKLSHIELFNRFHSGALIWSIDGIGKTYEFIRGQPFSIIEENLPLLKELKRHIQIEISFTSSIYNVRELPVFLTWCHQLQSRWPNGRKFQFNFVQIVEHPDYQSPLLLPLADRRAIAEEIQRLPFLSQLSLLGLRELCDLLQAEFPVATAQQKDRLLEATTIFKTDREAHLRRSSSKNSLSTL